jgi:hypothetical protein
MDAMNMFEKTRGLVWALVMCSVLVLGACDTKDVSTTAPTPPEPPNPEDNITQNLRGQLPQKGRVCHDVNLALGGSVTFEIIELKPLPSLTVGLGLGQPSVTNTSLCSIIAEDRTVTTFELFLSEGLPAGLYCVCIFDVGNIFPGEIVDYVIETVHQ